MHRPVTGLRCQSRDSHEVGSGRTAVPGGQRKAAACAGLCRAVIHFSTPTRAHSYTVADLRIHLNRPQIHTQVVTLAARAGVTGASSHAGPGTRCERGGPMARDSAGSPHQGHSHTAPRWGRQRHVRWQVHTHLGPDRPPGGGNWGQGRGLATGPSKPRTGTGCVGLALAPPPAGNCAASGTQSGLESAISILPPGGARRGRPSPG